MNTNQFVGTCYRDVVPSPPTTIKDINITNFTASNDYRFNCTITWSSPEYINGHNLTYYLWIGAKQLEPDIGLPSRSLRSSEILYIENINVSYSQLKKPIV